MEEIKSKMPYVNLGRSGIKVSKFSYGNLSFWTQDIDSVQAQVNKMIKASFDAGINFFDTAEVYAHGAGEKMLGTALKALNVPRSDYVVTTKLYFGVFPETVNKVNQKGCSRKRLTEGMNKSLERLQLDYVDVVFCHRYDHHTPTIEVIQTIKDILESGKALYWATSNWPVERIFEAILLSDIIGCPRPICEQCEYSMFHRHEIERHYVPLFKDYGLATMIWSPLNGGVLTGKYNDGFPEGSRFHEHKDWWTQRTKKGALFSPENRDATFAKLRGLGEIAKELGCTQAQLAIAWTLKIDDVTNVIVGAKNEKQLKENLEALNFVDKITPEVAERIETLLDNRPEQDIDHSYDIPLPDRR